MEIPLLPLICDVLLHQLCSAADTKMHVACCEPQNTSLICWLNEDEEA